MRLSKATLSLRNTSNVLDKVSKSVRSGLKESLREVDLAPTRTHVQVAVNISVEPHANRNDPARPFGRNNIARSIDYVKTVLT
jgi:hypothetical protein